jgi:CitMHS family citrate-Mg2+:H+ or citrate-Ca2+:H+ symporter
LMASTLMAAGVFTGIMTGSGMLGALAHAIVAWLPSDAGLHIPVVLGFFSMPLSFLFDPDSYYFGVLPVLAEITRHAGGQPIAVGQASLLGVMTTGFPVSPLTPATFLVTGLSGISLASHQKFTAPWLCVASVVMTIAAVAVGVLAL